MTTFTLKQLRFFKKLQNRQKPRGFRETRELTGKRGNIKFRCLLFGRLEPRDAIHVLEPSGDCFALLALLEFLRDPLRLAPLEEGRVTPMVDLSEN